MKITALVPIRSSSERITGKNKRLFNGVPLFTVIFQTLEDCNAIDKILVNSDCPEVRDYVTSHYSKCVDVERPDHLKDDKITLNTLIEYDLSQTDATHFFQTHCTNPLLSRATISKAIQIYFDSLAEHDSLFAATKIQARLYRSDGGPLNHSLNKLQRTQDMPKVYQENSNFFIFSRDSFFNANKSRIGLRPKIYEMSKIEAVDIDYEEDFLLAELIDRNRDFFPQVFQEEKSQPVENN